MSVIKKTQCNMCAASCGLEMVVENNEIVSVRPDPDSPKAANYCCRKGRAARHYINHPDRLTHPLKRVGDQFVPISWEQANKEIAEKANAILKKHGPKSLGLLGGTLAASQSSMISFIGFKNILGVQYHFNPVGIEFMGSWWSNGRIYGSQGRAQKPDDHGADNLILWGSNSYVTHQMTSGRKVLREISQNPNKKLIVIDPSLTESARMADMHISLRSGTDSLFARAMIAMIIENGWQDKAFIDKWCNGFDEILPWFKGFDVRGALEVCRVPYEQALELAQILSKGKWGVHQDLGIYCGRHNTLNSYLIITLAALTGTLLVPGGNITNDRYVGAEDSDYSDSNLWRTKDNYLPVAGIYPAGSFAPQVLNDDDDRIRAAFCSMSNPARSFPDSQQVEEALKNLELLVCDDICMTETTKYAHYILPAKSAYEGHEFNILQMSFPKVIGHLRQPVVEAKGDCKEVTEIWLDIADAMGLIPKLPPSLYEKAEQAAAQNNRVPFVFELGKYLISNKEHKNAAIFIIGKTLGKAMGSVAKSAMFATLLISPLANTGKMQRAGMKPHKRHFILNKLPKLKNISLMDSVFQQILDHPEGVVIALDDVNDADGYTASSIRHEDKKFHLYCDEINEYIKQITPEQEQNDLDQYPLVLSSGRHSEFGVNLVMRNPKSYQFKTDRSCVALISPFDAKQLNIEDGETIQVATDAGQVAIPAEISYRVARGYVSVPHHYGLNFNRSVVGVGANQLIQKRQMDKLTGNPLIRHVPCRVEKLS